MADATAENVATTSIDQLAQYLREHGETEITKLASVFRVDTKVIEHWCSILESANIAKLTNKMGTVYAGPMEIPKEEVKTFKSFVEVKASTLESDLRTREVVLSQLEQNITSLSKLVSDAQKIYKEKSPEIKRVFDDLDALYRKAKADYDKVKGYMDYVTKSSEAVNKTLDSLMNKIGAVPSVDVNAEEARKKLKDVKDKVALAKSGISELRKSFNDEINRQKKDIDIILGSTAAEIGDIEAMLSKEDRLLNENSRQRSSYKRNMDRIRKEMEKKSNALASDTMKASQNIAQLYNAADKSMKSMEALVDGFKARYGGLGDLDKKLRDISDALEKEKKEKEDLDKELSVLTAKLHAIKSMSTDNASENARKINETIEAADKITKKINKLADDVNGTREKTKGLGK